ncbi:MAG TPA: hypothetical protein VK797_06415 [Tepidisphaeraceae bacterium]|nr:hypothetical protein [Tepidisphaeraceae bacterium]
MKPHTWFATGILLFVYQFASAQTQPLATPRELQLMFDAKQYHTCLQQIARVMRAKGAAASAYDPDALQLLRGECFIQLGDRVQAIRTFTTAQKSANHALALTARASLLIVQASPVWKFDTGSGTIDIIDPQSRKQAMSALFSKELQKAQPAIRAAQNAQSLAPILAVVPKLKDLVALEVTATGQDKEMYPQFTPVGARARDLIAGALQALDSQIATIEHRANEPITSAVNGGAWWVTVGHRGLDSPDRAALEDAYSGAQQVYDVALQGQMTAEALNGNVERWKELVSFASQVLTHARNVADLE